MPKLLAALILLTGTQIALAESLAIVSDVELQPLRAQVARIGQALEIAGSPLDQTQRDALEAIGSEEPSAAVKKIQTILDPLCLAAVNINPESRVKVTAGPAPAQLAQQGWRAFLIKVVNEGGVTAPLRVTSPNAARMGKSWSFDHDPPVTVRDTDIADRWLELQTFDKQPLNPGLSGLKLEYRILELLSRDAGKHEGKLIFDVGQGTQDLGFRSELNVLFQCEPAVELKLRVLDDDGKPTTGSFVFRDEQQRVYPSKRKRAAPDFFFHDQVYRQDGETVVLSPGKYEVEYGRGPEYHQLRRKIEVTPTATNEERFQLKRWIKVADHGWYSGDHHVHAAGCGHYESPSQGVQPAHMLRHILGEDLNVGCVLSWGPCWYYQKQFFDGKVSALSVPSHLMRYDVEVSGFPSSHCGHLCLLGLNEDDYPGTTKIDEWPSWTLPVLKWAKQQGAVVGFAHSGNGLRVAATTLPNYEIPPFDGIGANEFIVDVTHGVCDFISTNDTQPNWELNIWYHTLNCGYTTRISGETDFPCLTQERVGMGRVYVGLGKDKTLNYADWVSGVRDGRSYCTDGRSHLIDFQANKLGVGQPGADGRTSVLKLNEGQDLQISVQAAALLEKTPNEKIRQLPLDQSPLWHLERARVGATRQVPVELVVNGEVVERQLLEANGEIRDLKFKYRPTKSCWVALRILPSSHTNPLFVEVDGKPIRASRKSAQWCLDSVDACWKQKTKQIRAGEQAEAAKAYEDARLAYRKILSESAE